jgi:hypothetical protein
VPERDLDGARVVVTGAAGFHGSPVTDASLAVDLVRHAPSPASPVDHLPLPIQTLPVGTLGTHIALGLGTDAGAAFLLCSASEGSGEPDVHPQPETCGGHIDPIGPRGVDDLIDAVLRMVTRGVTGPVNHGSDARVATTPLPEGPRRTVAGVGRG